MPGKKNKGQLENIAALGNVLKRPAKTSLWFDSPGNIVYIKRQQNFATPDTDKYKSSLVFAAKGNKEHKISLILVVPVKNESKGSLIFVAPGIKEQKASRIFVRQVARNIRPA